MQFHLSERLEPSYIVHLFIDINVVLGISMIYTLIEYAKENQSELTQGQLEREEKEVKEEEAVDKSAPPQKWADRSCRQTPVEEIWKRRK